MQFLPVHNTKSWEGKVPSFSIRRHWRAGIDDEDAVYFTGLVARWIRAMSCSLFRVILSGGPGQSGR